MRLKKNWLYFLFILLAITGMLYLFILSFASLGENQSYKYFMRGIFLLILFGIWMLIRLLTAVCIRLQFNTLFSGDNRWVRWAKVVFVGVVLVLAAGIRLWVIGQLPEANLQEYRDYYDIAQALKDDSVQRYGEGYSNSIAAAPTVMGYSYILLLAFRIFGTGVRAGQYLNVFFSVAAAFFAYKIGKKAGGGVVGIIALLCLAFCPTGIFATALLSHESAFLFLVLLCIWIFLSLVMDYDGDTEDALQAVLLHLLLGALLAVAAAVSAAAVILLLAMILFLIPWKMKLPVRRLNDIPLMVRAIHRGWMRCIMILIPYIILTGVITSKIELTIDRTLPSMGIAFGSGLWDEMGHNFESDDRVETLDQAAERYVDFFERDDYGINKCGELLEEQEQLTKEGREFLNNVSAFNQFFYVGTMFFVLIALFYFLLREVNPAFLLIMLSVGIAVVSVFGGTSEYVFLNSQMFILLGAMSVWYTFEDRRDKLDKRLQEEKLMQKETEMEGYKLQILEQEEEKLTELRREAYANVFDMQKALEEGHIIMTVSQAYAKQEAAGSQGEMDTQEETGIQEETDIQEEAGTQDKTDIQEEIGIQEETDIQEEADTQEETGIQEETDTQEETDVQEVADTQEEADIQEKTGTQDEMDIQDETDIQEETDTQEKEKKRKLSLKEKEDFSEYTEHLESYDSDEDDSDWKYTEEELRSIEYDDDWVYDVTSLKGRKKRENKY